MTAEQKQLGRAEVFDFRGMSKVWRETYLNGLESCFRWQEENERLLQESVKQGFIGSLQWLTLYKNWMEMPWDQTRGQSTGIPNPVLTFARQSIQTLHGTTEPLCKTGADACEATFSYFESELAGPSRQYVFGLNKRVMDSVIPG
jgi:hypothetical protein